MPVPLADQTREPNKLVLCFDGTGNTFTGSNADTNVVKILNKIDRFDSNQYYYYQTGVGTYDINAKSVHKTWLGEMGNSISQVIDQAIGTTFDAHVMAGYRFLMRFYQPGDKIYMFGFSRGAFTAKFLARMLSTVGLLGNGNEEMVPFAYKLYQRYLTGELDDYKSAHSSHKAPKSAGGEAEPLLGGNHSNKGHGYRWESAHNEIVAFSDTFCQKERRVHNGEIIEANIKVYFLGIWDCVNSVAVFERSSPLPVPVMGTAQFVRHAVSVDERRVKFKPALLAQDVRSSSNTDEDIKEVWFPGCHGDVGGGWPATENDNLDHEENKSFWQRFKSFWRTQKAKEATKDVTKDAFQMSDVALSWMIHELELVGEVDPRAAIKWSRNVEGYKQAFARETSQKQALKGFIHDSLSFGTGTGFFTVLLWKFMEILPIITRWELYESGWERIRFPLNNGSYRDIPRDAVLHQSLVHRLTNVPHYSPGNNHGSEFDPCLKHQSVVPSFKPVDQGNKHVDPVHQTYVFPDSRDSRQSGWDPSAWSLMA